MNSRAHLPGAFTSGLKARDYEGMTKTAKRLAAKAGSARDRRVKWLRRAHSGDGSAQSLAQKLGRCRPKHRCHSGACPVCAQAAQECFVATVVTYRHEPWAAVRSGGITKARAKIGQPTQFAAVTIVPGSLSSPVGHLGQPSIAQVHRRLTDRLAKAKVLLLIGVLEVTLVEHDSGRYRPRWLWHLHGVAQTRDIEGLAKRLRREFPSTDMVPRPVRVVPWDGNRKWLRYCFKLDGRCRIGIDAVDHFDPQQQQPRTSRRTRWRRLSANEKLEFLRHFDSVSFDDRVLTKGAQLRSSSGGYKLVKMRRPKRAKKSGRRSVSDPDKSAEDSHGSLESCPARQISVELNDTALGVGP
jgi:hypothetical protein